MSKDLYFDPKPGSSKNQKIIDYSSSSSDSDVEDSRKRRLNIKSPVTVDESESFDILSPSFDWKLSIEKKLGALNLEKYNLDYENYEIDGNHWELKVLTKKSKRSSNSSQKIIDESSSCFKDPPSRCRTFTFKPFQRNSRTGLLVGDEDKKAINIIIPEQLAASYGLYIWPSSPVLSWYIWLHQSEFVNQNILELGAGTSLPGLLCGKIGAKKVWLTDDESKPDILNNILEAIKINEFDSSIFEVSPLSWGLLYDKIFVFENKIDIILGSDLFFDPKVFSDLIFTVSYLLSINPKAFFLCAVQERASLEWSIENLLERFHLKASYIFPKEFLSGTGIDEGDLLGGSGALDEELLREFYASADWMKNHSKKVVEQSTLLYLYGRYKRAKEGSITVEKPKFWDIYSLAKWQAWKDCSHLTLEESMIEYIEKVKEIDSNFQNDSNSKSNWNGGVSTLMFEKDEFEEQQNIFSFVREGNLEKVRVSLSKNPELIHEVENGLTLLHWASDRGQLSIVDLLLNTRNLNINRRDNDGQTALHYASSCGHEEIVRTLLKHGINKEFSDNNGVLPLDVAENDVIREILH